MCWLELFCKTHKATTKVTSKNNDQKNAPQKLPRNSPETPQKEAMMRRILLSLVLLASLSTSFSQTNNQINPTTGLSDAADIALESAREAAQEALNTYREHYLNLPLWQDAQFFGRQAEELAPGHPEPLRFLAEIYTITRWYAPAWETWNGYIFAGGTLDATSLAYIAEAGNQLAYDYYQRDDFATALDFYLQVISLVPGSIEAHVWAGQIYLDLEQPQQAIPYWQQVVSLNPNDLRAAYFLDLASDQAAFGIDAVNAFRRGVQDYEQGNLENAGERFAAAAALNGDYAEAWAWLGRTAFETGDFAGAAVAYERANSIEPANSTYSYFLQESRNRR